MASPPFTISTTEFTMSTTEPTTSKTGLTTSKTGLTTSKTGLTTSLSVPFSIPTSTLSLLDTANNISSITQTLSSSATSSGPHSSTSTSSATGHSAGVSAGAIVGIVIGCAVAGLVLGIIIAFLLFHRRKSREAEETGNITVAVKPKAIPSIDPSSGNDIRLNQFLLDATPDQEIATELQSLGELIHQHVENHYHLQPANASIWTLTQSLLSLGFTERDSGLNAEVIATLCIEPRSRQIGLRHIISHVVFASIDFHSRSRLSMFPAPVAAFLQSVPPAEHLTSDPLAMPQALSKWRSLSAFLLHPNRSQRTPLPIAEAIVGPQALALANALNTFLHFFVGPDQGSRQEQTGHLQAVVLECAKLGYVLLSHPMDWRFVLEGASATTDSRMVVVCAGLEKSGNRDGTPYRPPRLIVAPVEMPS